jgi:hypothetical protein
MWKTIVQLNSDFLQILELYCNNERILNNNRYLNIRPMKTQARCLSIYVLFSLVIIITASAQSPHGWRGPNRNIIYPETGLLKTWPLDSFDFPRT